MRIGVMGCMGSGKTRWANEYAKSHPTAKVMSIAEPVKMIARDLFGMEGKDRSLLQAIGTAFRRIDEDVWVNHLLSKLDPRDNCVVVDDVRFRNEAEILKRNGFMLLYMDVTDAEQKANLEHAYGAEAGDHLARRDHESEKPHLIRDLADYVVSGLDTEIAL